MNKILNEEHSGFAITFEVLATLFMITVFTVMTLYFLRVMNTQRYMNTVMTSTAAQASRWGGANTQAYQVNVNNIPLLVAAQNELNLICMGYNARIFGSPEKISYNNAPITIKIKYSLPPIFQTMSKVSSLNGNQYDMYNKTMNMNMSITVNSIMSVGKLL